MGLGRPLRRGCCFLSAAGITGRKGVCKKAGPCSREGRQWHTHCGRHLGQKAQQEGGRAVGRETSHQLSLYRLSQRRGEEVGFDRTVLMPGELLEQEGKGLGEWQWPSLVFGPRAERGGERRHQKGLISGLEVTVVIQRIVSSGGKS